MQRRRSASNKALLSAAEDFVHEHADYYFMILQDYQLELGEKVRRINEARGKFDIKTLVNAIVIVGNEDQWASSSDPDTNARVQEALEYMQRYTADLDKKLEF